MVYLKKEFTANQGTIYRQIIKEDDVVIYRCSKYYPEVYEMFLQLKAETEEIEKKEGLAAALRHIVKAREEVVSNMMYDLLFNN